MNGLHIAFAALKAARSLAASLLMSWGLFVLVVLGVGNFTLDGVMLQLGNLTDRYASADAHRIASFKNMLLGAQLVFLAAMIILRLAMPASRMGGTHGRAG